MSRPSFIVQKSKGHGRFRCGRKWGYPSAANAESDRQRLIGRTGANSQLQVYRCGLCKGYHVGRAPQERNI
jgi:hypothetical protein